MRPARRPALVPTHCRPPGSADVLSFSLVCRLVRLAARAGRRPNNSAVTAVAAAANASVRAFGATSIAIGPRPRDIRASSRLVSQWATATPAAPPAAARSALSVRNWRTIRPRAAPIDRRIAISCCLAPERTSIRPARLAHATSRTTPTAAIRIWSGRENCRRSSFRHRDRREERIAAEEAECVANVATEVGQHDHSPGQVSGQLDTFVERRGHAQHTLRYLTWPRLDGRNRGAVDTRDRPGFTFSSQRRHTAGSGGG